MPETSPVTVIFVEVNGSSQEYSLESDISDQNIISAEIMHLISSTFHARVHNSALCSLKRRLGLQSS